VGEAGSLDHLAEREAAAEQENGAPVDLRRLLPGEGELPLLEIYRQ